MFLNADFLGISYTSTPAPIEILTKFDKLTIYGEGVFDRIWITNRIEPSSFYDSLSLSNYNPNFAQDTVFLAEFNNTLSAGNISSEEESVEQWKVTKRRNGTNINKLVGYVDDKTKTLKDYRVQKEQEYIYEVIPITQNTMGVPLVSPTIKTEYYGCFLIDETTGMILNFDLNLNTGNISAEDDVTEYQTYGKFNTYSQGSRNFLKGTISGIVPERLSLDTDEFIQSADFVKEVQDFINNGNPKLLKTRKGDIWKVRTHSFSRSQLNEGISQQVDVISFGFSQLEDVEEY